MLLQQFIISCKFHLIRISLKSIFYLPDFAIQDFMDLFPGEAL